MSALVSIHRVHLAAFTLFVLHVSSLSLAAAELRTWSSANGKFSVTAALVKAEGESVKLKREDGKVFDVKLSVLSQADNEYVQSLERRASQGNPGQRRLTLPGVMSIANPNGGFTWRSGGKRVADGVQAFRLLCGKDGSKSTVTLQLELRKADTDQKRSAAVQADYKNLLSRFAEAGLQEVKTPNLKIKAPIPDRVAFPVSAKLPDGSPFEFRVIHVFKENTYRFHIVGSSKEEADMLASVSETLKELGTTLHSTAGKMTNGRFEHPTYGVSFQPPEGFKMHAANESGVIAQFRSETGAVMNVRCARRSDDFDLNALFEKVRGAPVDRLNNFREFDSGEQVIAGKQSKWRIVGYQVDSTPLKVVQYYFANQKWVFIVTGTALADKFGEFQPEMSSMVHGMTVGT